MSPWSEWAFDPELWRWSSDGAPVAAGPAGLAVLEPVPGVRIVADAWNGALRSATVDAVAGDGRPHADATGFLDAVLGGLPSPSVAPVVSARTATTLGRWARVADGARAARAFGEEASAFETEAVRLAGSVGVDLGSAMVRGASTRVAVVGPVPPDVAADALAAGPHDLGRLPAAPDGVVRLDPSDVPGGVLGEAAAANTRWVDGPRSLHVEVPVAGSAYGSLVDDLWLAVLDGDDLIAVESLRPWGRRGESVVAAADLVVAPARDRSSLDLVITASPRHLPTAALRGSRASIHLARIAAKADRLGAPGLRDELLAAAAARWPLPEPLPPLPVEDPFDADLMGPSGTDAPE